MSDTQSNTGGSGDAGGASSPPPSGGVASRMINHMSANKVEAALWLTRLFTIACTFNFFLPIFGSNPGSMYQKALLSNAATSALRLHQRLPNFQLNREFFGLLLLEDSAHYLFYSLIFVYSYPITMVLVPLFLFALLHASSYTKQVFNQIGPDSVQIIRNLITKLEAHGRNVLRFIACNEIFLMPAIIFMLFSGHSSLLLPFVYYRFLTLRYSSRRNPYCRQLFYELRVTVESLTSRAGCPAFLRNMSCKAIGLIARLAPAVPAQ